MVSGARRQNAAAPAKAQHQRNAAGGRPQKKGAEKAKPGKKNRNKGRKKEKKNVTEIEDQPTTSSLGGRGKQLWSFGGGSSWMRQLNLTLGREEIQG
jgi:hypothetical protein